jgi:succinate-acetate transporter protein
MQLEVSRLMSTMEERRATAMAGPDSGTNGWATRVVLQPIAAPSVLGLFGFAGATLIVASNLAGWWGNADSPIILAPFAGFFGGLAQLLAGMWAYKARDAVATAMHGMWGAFWLAYMTLFILVATGQITVDRTFDQALGFWFIALAAITWSGMFGALAEASLGIVAVLGTLAAGSTLAAIGLVGDVSGITKSGGWLFVISAGCAWYMATAMMVAAASGRTVLPLFKGSAAANVPGRKPTRAIELDWAEPGVKQGQ